ncbi:MAG: hypothetical protein RLY66_215 [Candidatus Parcubacteria bacterium]|jgi:hypothetical protein
MSKTSGSLVKAYTQEPAPNMPKYVKINGRWKLSNDHLAKHPRAKPIRREIEELKKHKWAQTRKIRQGFRCFGQQGR